MNEVHAAELVIPEQGNEAGDGASEGSFARLLAWGLLGFGLSLLVLLSVSLIRAQAEVEAALVRLEALGPGAVLTDVEAALAPAVLDRYMDGEWGFRYRLHGSLQPIEVQVDAPRNVVRGISIRTVGSPILPLGNWRQIAVRPPVSDAMILCVILAFPLELVLAVRILFWRRPLWTLPVALATGWVQLLWAPVMLLKIRYGG